MEWLLIAGILLAAFGGVAYIIPSKYQRLVGNLRLEARKQGMFISSTTIEDMNVDAEHRVTSGGKARDHRKLCVEFSLPFERKLAHAPIWQLIRYGKSQLPIPGWLLVDNSLIGVQLSDTSYWASIAESIADMPAICRSVRVNGSQVSWIGKESKELVLNDEFLDCLRKSLEELSRLNHEISVANESGEEEQDPI